MRTTDNTSQHRRRGPRGDGPDDGTGGRRFRHGGFIGGPGFGPGFDGPRGWTGRGPRARRGDVRAAILSLLADGQSNGYGLIKAITDKTDGAWRPSPGSVYPTLAQLVDEELIEPTGDAGPRSEYRLTDTGRDYVAEHADQIASAWAGATPGADGHGELVAAARKLMGAVRQIASDATPEQRHQAASKLDELRRELYRILGE
jgi:DNA-binding PadR family transcriptional regulator